MSFASNVLKGIALAGMTAFKYLDLEGPGGVEYGLLAVAHTSCAPLTVVHAIADQAIWPWACRFHRSP